jgi:hypothetical protein
LYARSLTPRTTAHAHGKVKNNKKEVSLSFNGEKMLIGDFVK